MEQSITCEYNYDKKVCFALQQNHVPVIKSLAIANTSQLSLSNIKIEITAHPAFAEPFSLHINQIAAGETVEVRPDLLLSYNFLSNLDERIVGHLNLKITADNIELFHKNLPLDVLSFDSWPGSSVLPEIISSFITPNRPFISEIIKQASEIMETNTGTSSMDGYQSGDPNRVLAQLSAIFSAIQSQKIAYANPPASFEEEGQKVRFPETIKQHKLATCLDTSLLYAACAEAIGIHPIIVFLPGHAFPAFWLKEYASSESFQDDKSILTKNMADGINDLIAVESTLLTQPMTNFHNAVQSAENDLHKPGFFHFFIDVRRSRIGHIKPISLKIPHQAQIQNAAALETPTQSASSFTLEKIDVIPESDTPPNSLSVEENKVTYWQNRLIDMSLRNNLLNYRILTQGIPVITSDVAKVEDILAMGNKVFIQPLPSEWRNKARDFREQKELLHSQILQEDMKNNRLRSTLTEIKLEQELVKLYRKAKSTLEESGANSLFVALGFLKWYESKSYTKERFAPILLLPVDLVRLSAKKGYYIRIRDEEVQINISLIEYLKQKFGIDASRLYDIPTDDHGADVKKVLTTMRRLIMPMKNWDVEETASIGVFSFSKFVMWNDLVNHAEELKKNTVVKSLIEGNYAEELSPSMTEPFTTKKDEQENLYTPLSADSTQTEAILAAGNENSYVLHGPPGSGKSQTITNMISHALASGKSVLFVAEKMAALSVVQKRLADIGLGNFCLEVYSNKAQKKDILSQLEDSFEAHHKTKSTDWAARTEEMQTLKKELNKHAHHLHRPTTLGQSIFEMIEIYSATEKPKKTITFNRDQVKNMEEKEFKQTKQLIESIVIAGKTLGDLTVNPWSGIKQTTYSLQLHDSIREKLATIQTYAKNLQLENELAGFGLTDKEKRHSWYQFIYRAIPYLKDLPNTNLSLLGEKQYDRINEQIIEVIANGKQCDKLTEEMEKRFDSTIIKLDAETLLQDLRLAENSWFFKKMLDKNRITKELKKYLKAQDKIEGSELERILTTVQRIQAKQQFLDQHRHQMETYFPDQWKESEVKWQEIEQALDWFTAVHTLIKDINSSQEYITNIAQTLEHKKDDIKGSEIRKQMDSYAKAYEKVINQWEQINHELIVQNVHEPAHLHWAISMEEKVHRLTAALFQLKDSCHLAHVVEEANAFGLKHVTQPYLKMEIGHDDLLSTYLYGFYRIRIDTEITSSKVLSQFTKADFEHKLQKFSELDEEISELTKLEVYVQLMERVPDLMKNVIQSSEPGILLKAIKSKGRGIAIRQLFDRITTLLPKIKPCMLMSPLSVAQYLSPSYPKFDLVIFDEASQLPTSEAVGAMARGKNVIVVGDPKQLPPTSFFSAQQTEENFELQDLESVLDDCLSIRMPQKHLRWHYRSEHESLISFSNNHFYENKLVTFPSIDDIASRVSFRNVKGIYDRGKTKQNIKEAEAIVEEVFSRLSDPVKQRESIGIVTFSQVQQTLIEDMVDERLKEDSSLEKYFTDEVQEPVFVKNLENVQGDERDTILFAVGYGPDETGHMTLNFGPLNRDGGWRRLNVAVSRAKKEMIIFASMEPDQINLSRTKAEGLHSLRAFMEFAKRGNEPLLLENRTHSIHSNSILIIPEVKNQLEQQGYKVEANVGSSDFKIDLAVVDQKREGHYLTAIQIDGHRHASRTTTRDRHKLSDQMLGKLGWQVIKIWTIEWWHNEEKQLENILAQLREIEENNEKQVLLAPENQKVTKQISIQEKISKLIIPEQKQELVANYYQPTQLGPVLLPSEVFYTDEGASTIRSQIEQIIAQEAPISFSQLTKQIIEAWGFSRSGAKIEAVINASIKKMLLFKTSEKKGKFLWKNKEQYEAYRDFRLTASHRRAIQDISKQEYANGVLAIVESALRLPKADLTKEVLNQLGYSRTSAVAEKYVQEAIEWNVEKGSIEENPEGIVGIK